jgi:hypothetical protein
MMKIKGRERQREKSKTWSDKPNRLYFKEHFEWKASWILFTIQDLC